MAEALKEKRCALEVYNLLKDACCPLVEGLFLQEESMLQLLCTPSQHRTDILTWICSSINPDLASSKASRSKDPELLTKEMASLGQELMLCRATDLDLIRGGCGSLQQLLFMKQLLTLVPPSGVVSDVKLLLSEMFSPENISQLRLTLQPSLDPWSPHIRALGKGGKHPQTEPRDEEEVSALLSSTQSALDQLHSECEFLKDPHCGRGFSCGALKMAAVDLHQMMLAFSLVYDTDLRPYCGRAPPAVREESSVFRRVHQMLSALNTELAALEELALTSGAVAEAERHLQTKLRYWSRRQWLSLPDQLGALSQRYRGFLSQRPRGFESPHD